MVAPNAGNSCTYRRPGYKVVAIEKDPRAPTVEGDAEGIVPRNCHVEVAGPPRSMAPISVGHCRIPKAVCAAPGMTEPPPHCVFRQIAHLGSTIVVPLRWRDEDRDRPAAPPGAPLPDRLTQNFGDIGLFGSGTRSSNTVLAAEKVEERLFVAGTAGFAHDGEIRAVSADLTLSGPWQSRGHR